MTRAELFEKARLLPLSPGVYHMKNAAGRVIYVGKSRLLRNRVSSYFAQTAKHSAKTKRMVASVVDFEIFYTKTEVEALILECQFIKQIMPKYNIKLKDSTGYPYIQMTQMEYPEISVTYKRLEGQCKYYGPYTSVKTAYDIVRTAKRVFALPKCKRIFPKDIGKHRPCINYEIKQCMGVCVEDNVKSDEYREIFKGVERFLNGEYNELIKNYEGSMEQAAEDMEFERAAKFRDMIRALQILGEKQSIVAPPGTVADVAGLYTDEQGGALAILFIRNGAITDRETLFFGADEITDSNTLTSFLFRFYQLRNFIPKEIYTNIEFTAEDKTLLSEKLNENSKVKITVCRRGEKKLLTEQAVNNARELLAHRRETETKTDKFLVSLAQFLGMELLPEKIEAYDISNSGGEHTTCGMVVLEHGRFAKRKYRSFNIKTVKGQNDYGAMREAISRRLKHTNGDWIHPELILLDGGKQHVSVIKSLLKEMNLEIPVFGMIKDEHHKTRTLTDGENEVSLLKRQDLFEFFYKIQEETHKKAFDKMDEKRRKSVKTSSLYEIEGIGPKTVAKLFSYFGSIKKIKQASLEELIAINGISRKSAETVFRYYNKTEETEKKP